MTYDEKICKILMFDEIYLVFNVKPPNIRTLSGDNTVCL
jgi:hypothetical protein